MAGGSTSQVLFRGRKVKLSEGSGGEGMVAQESCLGGQERALRQ